MESESYLKVEMKRKFQLKNKVQLLLSNKRENCLKYLIKLRG